MVRCFKNEFTPDKIESDLLKRTQKEKTRLNQMI